MNDLPVKIAERIDVIARLLERAAEGVVVTPGKAVVANVLFAALLTSSAADAQETALSLSQERHYRCAIAEIDRAMSFTSPGPQVLYARGRSQQALGQFDHAVETYEAILSRHPDHEAALECRDAARNRNACERDPEPGMLLSDWHRLPPFPDTEEGRYRQVERDVDRMYSTDISGTFKPSDSDLILHFEKGELHHALAVYDRLLVVRPGLPAAIAGRGNVFAAQGKFEAAIASFTEAIELMPSRSELLADLTDLLTGPPDAARQDELRNLLFNFPHSRFVHLVAMHEARGRAYAKAGRLGAAWVDYANVLELVPEHIEALRALSRMQPYLEVQAYVVNDDVPMPVVPDPDVAKSRPMFQNWIYQRLVYRRFGPVDPNAGVTREESSYRRGRDYMRRGIYDLADRYFRMELVRRPRSGHEWARIARNLEAAGNHEAALAAFDKAIVDAVDDSVYVERGLLSWRLGDFDGALTDFNKLIDLNLRWADGVPGGDLPTALRGRLYASIGKYDLAISDLRAAIEVFPEVSTVHHWLGVSLALVGRFAEALQAEAETVRLAPRYARAYELKSLVHFAVASDAGSQIPVSDCVPARQ